MIPRVIHNRGEYFIEAIRLISESPPKRYGIIDGSVTYDSTSTLTKREPPQSGTIHLFRKTINEVGD